MNISHVHIHLVDKSGIVSLTHIDLGVSVEKGNRSPCYLTKMSKLYRGHGIVNGETQTHTKREYKFQ